MEKKNKNNVDNLDSAAHAKYEADKVNRKHKWKKEKDSILADIWFESKKGNYQISREIKYKKTKEELVELGYNIDINTNIISWEKN